MRVRFTRDWDHVEVLTTTTFKAGGEHTVRRDIGDAAVAAGAADEVGKSEGSPDGQEHGST